MANRYTVHAFAVCPVANAAEVNAYLDGLEPVEGAPYGPTNFSVPLNADGTAKAATHLGTHWVMTQAQWDQLSTDTKLQSLGVVWDATRGKMGDKNAQGKEIDRKAAWLAAVALKEKAVADVAMEAKK